MDQSSQGNSSSRIGPSDVCSSSCKAIPNIELVQQLYPQAYSLAPMPEFGYQVPQIYSLNISVVPTILIPCNVPTERENITLLSATQEKYNFSPGANLSSTVNEMRTDDEVTTSGINDVSFQKQKDESISVIKQELTESQKQNYVNDDITTTKNLTETIQQQDDDIICPAFNIKQEFIDDQGQNSSMVIPTTSKESCLAPEKPNDDRTLPTSGIEPKLAGAQGQNGLDLGTPLRVSFTSHQLTVLEEKFRMHRYPSKMKKVEISSELQLTEKQVNVWFQNRRSRCKKCDSRIEQNQESTEKQENIHHSAVTEEILNGTSLEQEYVSISPTPSIHLELTDTYNLPCVDISTEEYSIETMRQKSDSDFSSILSSKQYLIDDQEPNNYDDTPTFTTHSFVITDVRSISPTSSINKGLIEAQEHSGSGQSNLSDNIDLTERFRTICTQQQMEVLKSNVEKGTGIFKKKLQLPQKQVRSLFRNKKRVRKKVGTTILQKS